MAPNHKIWEKAGGLIRNSSENYTQIIITKTVFGHSTS